MGLGAYTGYLFVGTEGTTAPYRKRESSGGFLTSIGKTSGKCFAKLSSIVLEIVKWRVWHRSVSH